MIKDVKQLGKEFRDVERPVTAPDPFINPLSDDLESEVSPPERVDGIIPRPEALSFTLASDQPKGLEKLDPLGKALSGLRKAQEFLKDDPRAMFIFGPETQFTGTSQAAAILGIAEAGVGNLKFAQELITDPKATAIATFMGLKEIAKDPKKTGRQLKRFIQEQPGRAAGIGIGEVFIGELSAGAVRSTITGAKALKAEQLLKIQAFEDASRLSTWIDPRTNLVVSGTKLIPENLNIRTGPKQFQTQIIPDELKARNIDPETGLALLPDEIDFITGELLNPQPTITTTTKKVGQLSDVVETTTQSKFLELTPDTGDLPISGLTDDFALSTNVDGTTSIKPIVQPEGFLELPSSRKFTPLETKPPTKPKGPSLFSSKKAQLETFDPLDFGDLSEAATEFLESPRKLSAKTTLEITRQAITPSLESRIKFVPIVGQITPVGELDLQNTPQLITGEETIAIQPPILDQTPGLGQSQFDILEQSQSQGQVTDQKQKTRQKQIQEQIQEQAQAQEQVQQQSQSQVQKQILGVAQVQAQAQGQIQSMVLGTKLLPRQKPRPIPKKRRTSRTRRRPEIFEIVVGKPGLKVFKTFRAGSLSRATAIAKRQTLSTAAASFEILRDGRRLKEEELSLVEDFLGPSFRRGKAKEKIKSRTVKGRQVSSRFVQKVETRISSPGEKREITFKGLQAIKGKSKRFPRSKKQTDAIDSLINKGHKMRDIRRGLL